MLFISGSMTKYATNAFSLATKVKVLTVPEPTFVYGCDCDILK